MGRRACALLIATAAACGGDRPHGESTTVSSSSSGGAFAPENERPDACAAPTRLVYVISSLYDLLSFTPNTGTFERIGRVHCLEGTPNSMALDRYGTAWVNYSSGALYKVSTSDASCERTAYQPGQGGFAKFGMAFSSTTAANDAEQLFINGFEDGVNGFDGGHKAYGLASIDVDTLKLNPIGQFTGALEGQNAELTGTGDARLYGFLTTQPNATLAEIDKATGATSNARVLEGVNTGNAWAFSYWGGDFWFYTAQLADTMSTVTRLALSGDGSLSIVKTNANAIVSSSGQPFQIVGAGVSTCAPLEPPK